jgi:nickel-dependent lactate racemase
MELRLKYGETVAQAELPDFPLRRLQEKKIKGESGRTTAAGQFVKLPTKHIATLQKPADIIRQALDRPIGCHPFREVFRGARNVLIVIPDPAEETGAEHYLPVLRERLNLLHVPDEDIRLLIASAADSLSSSNATARRLADFAGEKIRIFWHDPRDHKSLEYAGLTRRGTPVFVNRLLLEADYVLLCGSVTHHLFAGYGGGPRMIVPGCAGDETIHRHFSHAIDPESQHVCARCRDAVIEGNPLQEDSREAFRFITTNFLLHTILNDQRQIVGVVAGEPLQAFAAGCKALDNMFFAPVAQAEKALAPANLVIVSAGGYPHDRDFRTAYAALHRAAQVARSDGVIIFLAECRNGLGSPALSHLLQGYARREQPMEAPSWPPLHLRRFDQNEIETLIALSILQKARELRIIIVTELDMGLAAPVGMQRLGFVPAKSLQAALAIAESWKIFQDIFSAVIIDNGTLLIPRPG